jgi:hypothetical protein
MSDCTGCGEPYPSAKEVEIGTMPDVSDSFKGLPTGTSKELPKLPGIVYSEVWAVPMSQYTDDHLSYIGMTVPEGFEFVRTNGDGCIFYEKEPGGFEPPGPIDGFECDPENQWFFRPLWESCSWRHYTTIAKTKCQCIDVLAKCSVNSHWVKYADCLKCKSRLPLKNRLYPVKKTRANLRLPDLDHNSK